MARSNGFFSLRRGSTKSLTFSVLNGRQITKDRVSQVRNPRTQRQQYQRAIMATVMAAYSHMKPIENHAFEGAIGKAANQQRFMAANARRLRSLLASSLNTDSVLMAAVAPKYPTVIPNSYVISEGSLLSQTFFTPIKPEPTSQLFLSVKEGAIGDVVRNHSSVKASQIANALGIYEGLQITFCMINLDDSRPLYPGTGTGDRYSHFGFYFNRLCFKKVFIDSDITFEPEAEIRDKEVHALNQMLLQFVDAENTTPELYNNITNTATISATSSNWGFLAEDILPNYGDDETFSFGIITSQVDSNLRDNAQMEIFVASDTNTWGLHPQFILDAWQGQGLIIGDSDKYLEGGDD